jgi:hypothetical protein
VKQEQDVLALTIPSILFILSKVFVSDRMQRRNLDGINRMNRMGEQGTDLLALAIPLILFILSKVFVLRPDAEKKSRRD